MSDPPALVTAVRVRVGVVMSLVVALGVAFAAALPGLARAETPVASYSTTGCPNAPHWRIAYRMYFADSEGRITSRSAIAAAETSIQDYVDDVGNDSACGVAATVDVFDEGDTVWPASPDSQTLPADTQSFLQQGDYDWVFYRFPSNAESYCAETVATSTPNASVFPVDPDGRLGCAGGPSSGDCLCEPWAVLMEHEWLHAVVAFYSPREGWPTPDVHGACAHGYGTNCSTDEHYFADMMQGKVAENGLTRGIEPDEWALQGTPAHPIIQDLRFFVSAVGAHITVGLPANLDVPANVQVLSSQGAVVASGSTQASTLDLDVHSGGSYSVCASLTASERYRAQDVCEPLYISGDASAPVISGDRNPHLALAVDKQGSVQATDTAADGLRLTLTVTDASGRVIRRQQASEVRANHEFDQINHLKPGRYQVCLSSAATPSYDTSRICVSHLVDGEAATLIRQIGTVPQTGGRRRLTLTVSPALADRHVTLQWQFRRTGGSAVRTIRKEATLRRTMRLLSPPTRSRERLYLAIRLKRVTIRGVPYLASTFYTH
jgi:hypothetical protein